MLHVACCLWDKNDKSQPFSQMYDESWAEKLYRGFKRNLTVPFRFVCFTDREREFAEPVAQERLETQAPDYGCLIEPFKLDEPTIICGLDTVVVANVDHMASYCMTASRIALPGHPTNKRKFGFINPVVFVPKGWRSLFDQWRGENDMEYLNQQPGLADANLLWPGQILSLKLQVVPQGPVPPPAARIIYFHGRLKPHELGHVGWINQHWR